MVRLDFDCILLLRLFMNGIFEGIVNCIFPFKAMKVSIILTFSFLA